MNIEEKARGFVLGVIVGGVILSLVSFFYYQVFFIVFCVATMFVAIFYAILEMYLRIQHNIDKIRYASNVFNASSLEPIKSLILNAEDKRGVFDKEIVDLMEKLLYKLEAEKKENNEKLERIFFRLGLVKQDDEQIKKIDEKLERIFGEIGQVVSKLELYKKEEDKKSVESLYNILTEMENKIEDNRKEAEEKITGKITAKITEVSSNFVDKNFVYNNMEILINHLRNMQYKIDTKINEIKRFLPN